MSFFAVALALCAVAISSWSAYASARTLRKLRRDLRELPGPVIRYDGVLTREAAAHLSAELAKTARRQRQS